MRKTFVHFFTIADYEEEEIWLREKHKAGWKFVKMIPPCIYIFESCTPQDVIYRLDYKNSEETEEYMQMLADFGWEYLTRCVGWLYFSKPAEGALSEEEGELFSDHESRANMASHIIKTRFLPLMLIFFGCVLPNLTNALHGALGSLSGFFAGVFGVMFVIYVYMIVYCGIKLKKIRDKYQR